MRSRRTPPAGAAGRVADDFTVVAWDGMAASSQLTAVDIDVGAPAQVVNYAVLFSGGGRESINDPQYYDNLRRLYDVVTGQYEAVFPFDIYPVHLLKAILVNDIEQMENLGLLEVAPEDFALCEFVCTSKIDSQAIVRQGLDVLKKETT